MSTMLYELGSLLRPPETYNAYKINSRPPQLGDVGTVVDVMGSPGVPDSYVYIVECRECVEPGGFACVAR